MASLLVGDSRASQLVSEAPVNWKVEAFPGANLEQLLQKAEYILKQSTYVSVCIMGIHNDITEIVCSDNGVEYLNLRKIDFEDIVYDMYLGALRLNVAFPETLVLWALPYPVDFSRYNIIRRGGQQALPSRGSNVNTPLTLGYFAAIEKLKNTIRKRVEGLNYVDLSLALFPKHQASSFSKEFSEGSVRQFPYGTADGLHPDDRLALKICCRVDHRAKHLINLSNTFTRQLALLPM